MFWKLSALWGVVEMLPSKEAWLHALHERHGKALQGRFSRGCVAICGLGGLGSHIALALARAGVGRLILIDFDRVELSNLHRQGYFPEQIGLSKTQALCSVLRAASPYVRMDLYPVRLTELNAPRLLSSAQIICEAFDDPHAKAMLADTVLTKMPGKYLIASSGMAGLFTPNTIKTRKITKRFYLCGDSSSDVEEGLGLVCSRVMLCAAHQAHIALRLLAGEEDV